MGRTIFSFALAAAVCPLAHGQQRLEAERARMPLKDAGVYHVGTGTWTRAAGAGANLGPDIIYRSDAPSGYFGVGWENSEGVDEGILPGTQNANQQGPLDAYCINGFQFGYCSTSLTPVNWDFTFYESYFPCDDPDLPANCINLNASFSFTGLPAGSFCWIVTVDLEGAGEFLMSADGGTCAPGYQGATSGLDHFGWGGLFSGTTGVGALTGPLLWGHDPSWVPDGEGTCYNPGFTNSCAGLFSGGLGSQDLFAAGNPLNGCFFFGGYVNTNGCGGPSQNPGTQFAMLLFTDCSSSDCEPPSGVVEPTDVFTASGATVQFEYQVPGASSYRWHRDEQVLSETGPVLTLPNVDSGDASNYFATALGLSPSSGTRPSRAASLIVDGQCGSDDFLEPNDTVSRFRAITLDASYTNLCVAEDDSDVYATRVAPGDTLDIYLCFTHSRGNIDVFLWDFETFERLGEGNTHDDDEHIEWTNGPECRGVLWQVVLRGVEGDDAPYDMAVSGASACQPISVIGRNYCASRMNSSGYPARIAAIGSDDVDLNTFGLGATQMPPNQFGYFLTSPRPGFILPGGSDGALCLSGGVVRFTRPGEVKSTGTQGRFALPLDLTDFPGGNSVDAGETWYFQTWFRDGMSSNFTDGVGVLFQ